MYVSIKGHQAGPSPATFPTTRQQLHIQISGTLNTHNNAEYPIT